MRDDFARLRRRNAFGHVTGWLSMALGGVILAGVVLTPAWIHLQYKQWEQGLIEAHAERQARQVRAYEEFTEALAASEPALLERLAYAQLRLKPADGELIIPPDDLVGDMSLLGSREIVYFPRDPNGLTGEQAYQLAMIDQWLYEPAPALGRDYPVWQPPRSRVVRLCTGPMRLPLTLLAGIFLYLGFLTPDPQLAAALAAAADDDQQDAEDDDSFDAVAAAAEAGEWQQPIDDEDGDAGFDTDAQPDVRVAPAGPDVEPHVDPDVDPEVEPDAEPELDPGADPELAPDLAPPDRAEEDGDNSAASPTDAPERLVA